MREPRRNAEWQRVALGTLAEFRNGVNYTKQSFGQGIKIINVKDFQDYTAPAYESLDEINPKGVVRLEDILQDGDIIFVRSNGNRELIGRSLYIDHPTEPITHSAFTIRLRLTTDKTYPRFYAYLFRSAIIRQAISMQGYGTNISNLNQQILTHLQVPLPPLEIQHKIADVLDAYSLLIENNTRRIVILEEMAQALYREWFVDFRFPGHEQVRMMESPLGPVPEGWIIVRLSDFSTLYRGRSYRGVDLVDKGGMPFLNLKCIERNGGFRYNGLKRYIGPFKETQTAVAGNIVVAVTDMTQERRIVAHAARVPATSEKLYIMSMDLVKVEPHNARARKYLYGLLRFSDFPDIVKQKANGVNVLHLSPEVMAEFRFAKPPNSLMDKYNFIVEDIYDEVDLLHTKLINLQQTRDLLLPKLISSELILE